MSDSELKDRLSQLPSMTALLSAEGMTALVDQFGREPVSEALRSALERSRERLRRDAGATVPTLGDVVGDASRQLAHAGRPNLRRVINATGIVLHTGLGRAPLAEEALHALAQNAGYCNLETDLESGKRSHRADSVRDLLCQLTGAEAATVVNNNAAATMIVLRALAQGREVIVSRGQLVEIGGSFRLPDIMTTSGAVLREVGTTNRTHLRDYWNALSDETALVMRVHSSNYKIVGFTSEPPLAELVDLAGKAGLRVVDDIGSGALFDVSELTGAREPVASESIAAGADVVLFSGDKLLGGPQAGVIVGKSECVQTIERDPLMRVVRVDKLMLSALEVTLRMHRDRDLALARIPLYRMLAQSEDDLRRRALALRRRLTKALPELACEVVRTESFVGGGSVPTQALPSFSVAASVPGVSTDALVCQLRVGDPSVFSRVESDRLLFDLRTVRPGEESEVVSALAACCGGPA